MKPPFRPFLVVLPVFVYICATSLQAGDSIWDKIKGAVGMSQTSISGEYRSGFESTSKTGQPVGADTVYDFRSDNSYSMTKSLKILDTNLLTQEKGTYKVDGNKLLLTAASFRITTDTTDEFPKQLPNHTLTIEPNGDLLDGDMRLKKQ